MLRSLMLCGSLLLLPSLSLSQTEVGVGYSSYVDQSTPEAHFRASYNWDPVYIWGTYEDLKVRIRGQPIASTEVFALGAGVQKNVGDFFVFGEIGYAVLDPSESRHIQQEVVYTDLVGNHNVYNRPVPVPQAYPYDQESYETYWGLDDGLLGALGVGYHWGDKVALRMAYRPFYVKEHLELWDPEKGNDCNCYWQETRTRDLSSWQFTVSYIF